MTKLVMLYSLALTGASINIGLSIAKMAMDKDNAWLGLVGWSVSALCWLGAIYLMVREQD
jgi:hypothetical protein